VSVLKKYYHWIVLVSCCLMVAISVGLFTNAYGVFYTPMSEKLGVGRGAVALHASIAGLMTGFVVPVVAKLLERIRLQIIIVVGSLLLIGTTILTAYAGNVWVLNAVGVVRGVGCACIYLTVVTIVLSNWFEKYYGTVLGVASSFSGLAGAVLSPIMSGMVESMGYQKALLFAALLVLILTLPAMLFCRLRPEEVGLRPLGAKEDELAEDITEEELKAAQVQEEEADEVHFLKNPSFWLMIIAGFVIVFITGLSQHLSGYTESIGLGTATGVMMLSASMVGNISFKLLMGILSDIIGPIKAVLAFICVGALGLVLILLCRQAAMMVAGAFCYGAFYSVVTVGNAAISRAVYSKKQYGSAYSLISMNGTISSAISITAIGTIYDMTRSYSITIVGMMICAVVGFVCQMLVGRRLKKMN